MKYFTLFFAVASFIVAGYAAFNCHKDCSINQVAANVAVVDSDSVIDKLSAFTDIQRQMKEQSSRLYSEFEENLGNIKLKEEDSNLLSEEAKKEKVEQFNQAAAKIREEYSKKATSLENTYKGAIEKILKEISKTAKQIAEKKGINLVLFISKKNQVLFLQDKLDLSLSVLEDLNERLPKFTLEEEKAK